MLHCALEVYDPHPTCAVILIQLIESVNET